MCDVGKKNVVLYHVQYEHTAKGLGVLDEILNLIESVSEDFPSYSN